MNNNERCLTKQVFPIHVAVQPTVLLNVLNEEGKISRSHGIPTDILQAQAAAIGAPLATVSASWEAYESEFVGALTRLKQQHNLSAAVYGDVDIQQHRDWEEKVSAAAGLAAVLPLWGRDRAALMSELLGAGVEAVVVSCKAELAPRFLGRTMTEGLVQELVAEGIDPCGEAGEYHSLVVDCPGLFRQRVGVDVGATLQHGSYCFAELRLY